MGFYYEEKKKDQGIVLSDILVVAAVIALAAWGISKIGSISTVLMVCAVASMVSWGSKWFQGSDGKIKFQGATKSASTVERGISNWLEGSLDGNNKFPGRKSIAVAVGAVVAWSILKLFGGSFRGATLIALAVGLVTACSISNWLRSLEEEKKRKEEEEKKRNEGSMTTALAVGAAAGLTALAAWGISKWLEPGSEPEDPSRDDEKLMMKRPGENDKVKTIPRDDFEADPADYFRRLRAKKKMAI